MYSQKINLETLLINKNFLIINPMILSPISWRTLPSELPVTTSLCITMIGLWILFFVGIIEPFIAIPKTLNTDLWTAHLFHATPLHLISNLLIALLTGILLERDLGTFKYGLLMVLILNLTVLFLFYYNPHPVFGFSAIAMGLMVFAAGYHWDNSYNRQLLVVLVFINIMFGLFPGVSWHGHLFGGIAGIVAFGAFYLSGLIKH